MGKLVEYLKIFRAHTSPVTVLTLVVYYYLAGGEIWSATTLAIVLLGIYLHWCGFGHNSVMDYHYDINDPHKKHFPLVRGTIKYEEAKAVINWMMMLGALVVVAFTLFVAENKILALASLVLYIQMGHSYNDGLDKVTIWKWVPEALCYMFLASWAYFLASKDISTIYWLSMLYMFLVIMYEIYWEGELKEIKFGDEVNILRHFGSRVEDDILYIPKWLQATSYLINIAKLIIGALIIHLTSSLAGLIIFAVGAVIVMHYVRKMTKSPRIYDHDKELEYMGNAEAFGLLFFTLGIMAKDATTFAFGLVMFAFSLGWYLLFNKIQWGVAKRPQV